MKILFCTKYSARGASSRYRSFAYADHFTQSGADVRIKPLFPDAYLKLRYSYNTLSKLLFPICYLHRALYLLFGPRSEVLIIEKELFPYLPYFIEKIFLFRFHNYTLDYDDATYEYYRKPKSVVLKFILGRKHEHLMKLAKLVTVGNREVQGVASKYCSNVQYLPTTIDVKKYFNTKENQRRKYGFMDSDYLIGWIGTPNSAVNLKEIVNQMEKFLNNYENCKLVLIGGGDKFFKTSEKILYFPWSESTEAELLSTIDVGIMPLRDQQVERGKSALKIIQYLISGKRVIASDVGENRYVLRSSFGSLITSNDEWYECLVTEYESNQADLSEEIKTYAKDNFGLEVWAPRYFDMVFDVYKIEVKSNAE